MSDAASDKPADPGTRAGQKLTVANVRFAATEMRSSNETVIAASTMHSVTDLKLNPLEPLTQVVFVHDYVQLVFETETLAIYNLMRFHGLQGEEIEQGQTGFADALVGLIGAKAVSVNTSQAECLALQFENKGRLAVTQGAEGSAGPEGFQFSSVDGLIVVQQNG